MIMPPERATHSILFSMGEMHALMMFAQAITKYHPELLPEIENEWHLGLANIEMLSKAGDAVIDGYQFAVGAIRRAAATA